MSIVINDGKCKGMSVAVSMAKEIQEYDLVLTNFTKFNKINLNEVGKYDGKCSGGGRCCSIRRAKKTQYCDLVLEKFTMFNEVTLW